MKQDIHLLVISPRAARFENLPESAPLEIRSNGIFVQRTGELLSPASFRRTARRMDGVIFSSQPEKVREFLALSPDSESVEFFPAVENPIHPTHLVELPISSRWD